jgi:hypothetical protein
MLTSAHGFGGVEHFEPVLPRDLPGLRAGIEADDHVAAAVLQIEGVGVALRPVAEHGQGFVREYAEIGVLVGVDFGRHDGSESEGES